MHSSLFDVAALVSAPEPSSGVRPRGGGPSPVWQPTPSDESLSSVRGTTEGRKESFQQRLKPEVSEVDQTPSLPSTQVRQAVNPTKALFDDLATGSATALATRPRFPAPVAHRSEENMTAQGEHPLIEELQANFARHAELLCQSASTQLSQAVQSLHADLACLQAEDAAFLDAALAQHSRVLRPLSSTRFRVRSTHANQSRETSFYIGDKLTAFATQLEAAETRLHGLWSEWEKAQLAVAEAARDVLKSPGGAAEAAGGAVMSVALFREKIQNDMNVLAANALEEMTESEKMFKTEIFDEQDALIQVLMSKRSQYD